MDEKTQIAARKFIEEYKPTAAELLAFLLGYVAAFNDEPSLSETNKRMLEM